MVMPLLMLMPLYFLTLALLPAVNVSAPFARWRTQLDSSMGKLEGGLGQAGRADKGIASNFPKYHIEFVSRMRHRLLTFIYVVEFWFKQANSCCFLRNHNYKSFDRQATCSGHAPIKRQRTGFSDPEPTTLCPRS